MSETQALLHQSSIDSPSARHHLFFRICHSPWLFIGLKTLLLIRFLIFSYLMAVWVSALLQQIHCQRPTALFAFRAGIVSCTLQLVYYAATTVRASYHAVAIAADSGQLWILQYLHAPRPRPSGDGHAPGSVGQRVFTWIPTPRTADFNPRARFALTAFYSAVLTFPLLVTFLYWMVMGGSDGDVFNGDRFHDWVTYSIYGGNPIVTVAEIVFLSSIRTIESVEANCVALPLMHALYLVWAWLGHSVAGEWTTPLLDPNSYEPSEVIAHILVSIALTLAAFLCVVGLHELRYQSLGIAGSNR